MCGLCDVLCVVVCVARLDARKYTRGDVQCASVCTFRRLRVYRQNARMLNTLSFSFSLSLSLSFLSLFSLSLSSLLLSLFLSIFLFCSLTSTNMASNFEALKCDVAHDRLQRIALLPPLLSSLLLSLPHPEKKRHL